MFVSRFSVKIIIFYKTILNETITSRNGTLVRECEEVNWDFWTIFSLFGPKVKTNWKYFSIHATITQIQQASDISHKLPDPVNTNNSRLTPGSLRFNKNSCPACHYIEHGRNQCTFNGTGQTFNYIRRTTSNVRFDMIRVKSNRTSLVTRLT